jgi:hypothetical protein
MRYGITGNSGEASARPASAQPSPVHEPILPA